MRRQAKLHTGIELSRLRSADSPLIPSDGWVIDTHLQVGSPVYPTELSLYRFSNHDLSIQPMVRMTLQNATALYASIDTRSSDYDIQRRGYKESCMDYGLPRSKADIVPLATRGVIVMERGAMQGLARSHGLRFSTSINPGLVNSCITACETDYFERHLFERLGSIPLSAPDVVIAYDAIMAKIPTELYQ